MKFSFYVGVYTESYEVNLILGQRNSILHEALFKRFYRNQFIKHVISTWCKT
jgi:hypothetical protein